MIVLVAIGLIGVWFWRTPSQGTVHDRKRSDGEELTSSDSAFV